MNPDRNFRQPWLSPRRLLRSERVPESFEELYDSTLLAMDTSRVGRRDSVVRAFELLWSPTIDQLTVDSPQREAVLNELIDAHILYRALRSSLDRTPQLESVRRDIESVRSTLERVYEKLRSLSTFQELEQAERASWALRGGTTTRFHRKIDDALLSRMFELRSQAALGNGLAALDWLLESVWGKNIAPRRGQPRKYSKDFLILRLARIFNAHKPDDRLSVRRYREHPNISPENHDRGHFYRFVLTAFSIVEVSFRPATFGLEKSIQDMLRLRRRQPAADLLVRRSSTIQDLAKFAELTESKRGNS